MYSVSLGQALKSRHVLGQQVLYSLFCTSQLSDLSHTGTIESEYEVVFS